MADTYKLLAQSRPAAATTTPLYTVPGATSTIIASIIVANDAVASDVFRITIAQAGAADATSQRIYPDIPILGNETFVATIGITLAATDVIRVRSGNGAINFHLVGVEVT